MTTTLPPATEESIKQGMYELEHVLFWIDKTADAWKAMSLKYVGDPDFDGCIVAGYGLLKKEEDNKNA